MYVCVYVCTIHQHGARVIYRYGGKKKKIRQN